ncbi:MAG: ArsR/SmtB family transcription factor [Planctomycetota bacterium]
MTQPAAIQEPPPLDVIRDPERAGVLLHPMRARILDALAEPDSATGVARRLRLPRQKVNYHLRELERAGFVRLVEERQRRNCIERIVRATARAYVISPDVLRTLGRDPEQIRDRFSASYLIALAARLIEDLAVLRQRADEAGQTLPTLSLCADVRFRSAGDRDGFADELAAALARLIAKYHDDDAPDGRLYRFVLGAHPVITKTAADASPEQDAPVEPAEGA